MADTTIDSLSIKIVSSATEAASSLERVSAAIKKMNAGKKANQTLDFLTKLGANLALVNMHSGAVTGLEKIASAMNTLSGVKSLAKATNGLASLAPAINALHSANLDGVSEKMNTVAKALEPFAGLKGLTGLSSAMKGLKDLPSVTEKLTPEVLDAFAEKVKKVSEAVTPLSTKMTTVAQGFKAIGYEAKSSGQNVEEFQKSISNINIASLINIVNSVYEFSRNVTQTVNKITKDIVDFDGIIERFNRGFGGMAQGTYSWIQRLNKEMGINVQQFMQYSSIFAQMLEGLGVAQKDASQMAVGYTELAYDIWAAYNDIYEGYSDAVAAVQSAIAGQTRPLRRAGFSVLNTTLEQTAANHGLEISIQSATEAEKSYLRYLALVDQAHAQGIVGTYAKEMNTAEGMLRTLGQQMKTLTQEAGNLLLPLLTVVVPRVQAAVRIISGYIKQLAALFGVTLITPEWDSSVGGFTEALEDAAESAAGIESGVGGAASAAKELKKTLLGIDEINQLNAQDKSSGGGGGGGGSAASDIGSGLEWDVSSLWTEAIFKDINRQVDEIEENFRKLIPVIEFAGLAATGITLAVLLNDLDKSLEGMSQLKKFGIGAAAVLADIVLNVAFTEVVLRADSADASTQIFGLLGEWLASAGAGLVLGKVMGNTQQGLAIGLAIGAVVQIATLSFEVAKGNTSFHDSNFWVQQLSSLVMGSLAGFLLFGGPTGLAIGFAATLAIEILGYSIAWANGGAAAEGFRHAFGEGLGLTDEEISIFVKRAIITPRTVDIDGTAFDQGEAVRMLANVEVNLEQARTSMNEAFQALSQDAMKIKIGFAPDDTSFAEDVKSYISAVQSFIDNTYQQGAISLSLLGMNDSTLNGYFESLYSSGAMSDLLRLMNELMTEGTMTNKLGVKFEVPEDQRAAAALELSRQIQEIVDQAAQLKYEAELTGLQLRAQGNMSGEEIVKAIAEATQIAAERTTAFDSAMDTLIMAAREQFNQNIKDGIPVDEANRIYQQTIDEVYSGWAENIISINGDILNFGMGKLMEGFEKDIPDMYSDYERIVGMANTSSFDTLASTMMGSFEHMARTVSPEARAAIKEIMESLEPTNQQTQRVVTTLQQAGQSVDQGLIDGLNDSMKLAALTGSADAINYMVGYEFSKSDSFKAALREAGVGFEQFDEYTRNGILNNMDLVFDASGTVVTGVRNRITGDVIEITPEVVEAFRKLGIDLTQGFVNAVGSTSSKTSIYKTTSMTIGEAARAGLEVLDEHSPSKVFFTMGVNAILGFKNGVGDQATINAMLAQVNKTFGQINPTAQRSLGGTGFARTFGQNIPRDIASGVETNLSRVSNAAANVVANFKIDTDDSIHSMRRMGGNLVKGIVEGMETESTSTNTSNKLSNVTNNLEGKFAKFNRVSSPSKLYRDEIGVWLTRGIVEGMDQPDALVDPLKSMYGTAKDWWDSNAVDVGNGTFSFESDTGKEHYMNLKDASNESNALLREQNALLRQILEKEVDGGGYGTTGEAMIQAASHLNRKTGRTMIPVGG